MKKWVLRAKFNKSLVFEELSRFWKGNKDGQFLYFGKGNWGSQDNATLFKTEGAAKSSKTMAQRLIDEGYHLPIEDLEIVVAKITIG